MCTCAHICDDGASLERSVRQQSLARRFERPPYLTLVQWVCAAAASRRRVYAAAVTCPVILVAMGPNPRLCTAVAPRPRAICSHDALLGPLTQLICAAGGGGLFSGACAVVATCSGICTVACMSMYTDIWIYKCTHARVWACMYTCTCMRAHACVLTCM